MVKDYLKFLTEFQRKNNGFVIIHYQNPIPTVKSQQEELSLHRVLFSLSNLYAAAASCINLEFILVLATAPG